MRRLTMILAVIVVFTTLALSLPCLAQENSTSEPSIMSIQGFSVEVVKPDVVEVTLGVDSDGLTARSAQEKNASKMDSIVKALKALGIGESAMKTSRFTLSPVYSIDKNTKASVISGYRALNRLIVKTNDLKGVGRLIDASIAAGGTNIEQVLFTLEDASEHKLTALAEAAKDARRRAEVLAKALGVAIKGIKKVYDSGSSVQSATYDSGDNMKFMARQSSMETTETTPISENDVHVSASVSIEFVIE